MFKYVRNDIFLFITCGIILSFLLGFISFGFNIFNPHSPLFQITIFGFIGAVSFALFQKGKIKEAISIDILIFILHLSFWGMSFLLTKVLYFVGVVSVIFIFSFWIYNKLNEIRYVRPLILSAIFSIIFVLLTLLLTLIYYTSTTNVLPFQNMPIGFLIGLGLGLGFELAEYLISK